MAAAVKVVLRPGSARRNPSLRTRRQYASVSKNPSGLGDGKGLLKGLKPFRHVAPLEASAPALAEIQRDQKWAVGPCACCTDLLTCGCFRREPGVRVWLFSYCCPVCVMGATFSADKAKRGDYCWGDAWSFCCLHFWANCCCPCFGGPYCVMTQREDFRLAYGLPSSRPEDFYCALFLCNCCIACTRMPRKCSSRGEGFAMRLDT
tara:strand:+ start:197 stop:811 length:615 start_codon:yes stop_codon:yes gene_type:complete